MLGKFAVDFLLVRHLYAPFFPVGIINTTASPVWKTLIADWISPIIHIIALFLFAMPALNRGPWSAEEDRYLLSLVPARGAHNWVRISAMMQSRSPKQCRERYNQNLKPGLRHDPITAEEELIITQLVSEMGHRWADISRRLVGRSDNAIKNWWNGRINQRRRSARRLSAISAQHSQPLSTDYVASREDSLDTTSYSGSSHHGLYGSHNAQSANQHLPAQFPQYQPRLAYPTPQNTCDIPFMGLDRSNAAHMRSFAFSGNQTKTSPPINAGNAFRPSREFSVASSPPEHLRQPQDLRFAPNSNLPVNLYMNNGYCVAAPAPAFHEQHQPWNAPGNFFMPHMPRQIYSANNAMVYPHVPSDVPDNATAYPQPQGNFNLHNSRTESFSHLRGTNSQSQVYDPNAANPMRRRSRLSVVSVPDKDRHDSLHVSASNSPKERMSLATIVSP